MLSASEAVGVLNAACEHACAARAHEVQAALVALALAVRQVHPEAARVRLEDSDQGDWLILDCWFDKAGQRHEVDCEDDDLASIPSHLYTPDVGFLECVEVASRASWGRTCRYLVHLDAVICVYGPQVAAAVPVEPVA